MSPAITLVLALIVIWALATGRLEAIWQGVIKGKEAVTGGAA